jgi:3-hydroxyisobutyrate dehydrogenase-like beta-hydroxyacid dehydrogenase
MGSAAAANIQRAGHQLRVHDLDRTRATGLVNGGGVWADSAAEVAAAVDVIFTMLPGPKQIDAAMCGPRGVLARIRPGTTWIDMTTNSPTLFRALAAEVRNAGGRPVDAPVTGAVDGAIQGRLTVFAGGDGHDVAAVEPLLRTMGRVLYMGPSGAGSVTKLLTNQLWFIHAAAIDESLVLGKAAGIEPLRLWEAMKGGAADSFVCQHDVPSIFAGHFDPSFSLDLCCKDLALIAELAEQCGTPTDMTRLAQQKFELARQTYGGAAGELHVCKLIEDAAQIDLRVPGTWTEHWKVEPDRGRPGDGP